MADLNFSQEDVEKMREALLDQYRVQIGREMNFMVCACYLLNNLDIKYEDICADKAEVLRKLKERYSDRQGLAEIVAWAIDIWTQLEPERPKTTVLIYPGAKPIISRNDNEYLLNSEKFLRHKFDLWYPSPAFLKTFLKEGGIQPMLVEITTLFFERLEEINQNDAKLLELFKMAIENFNKPVNLDQYIIKSRYFRLLFGSLSLPALLQFKKILERIGMRKVLLAGLDKIERELVANEVVDIFYKLLEGAVKNILWVTFNFSKITQQKHFVPMDRTLGDYANLLNLQDKVFKYLRDSTGHIKYEFKFIPDSKDLQITFYIQEQYKGPVKTDVKTIDEFFALVQTLNATVSIFKTYMETYVQAYELAKEKKTLDDLKEDHLKKSLQLMRRFWKVMRPSNSNSTSKKSPDNN